MTFKLHVFFPQLVHAAFVLNWNEANTRQASLSDRQYQYMWHRTYSNKLFEQMSDYLNQSCLYLHTGKDVTK